MRFSTVKIIYEAALKDKNIFFLAGDLNHFGEEEFLKNLPKQYLNVGIQEQNIIGMAAGLALTGRKVFAYSIVPFITMRGLEQIKNDVCYQNLDVTLIGVGGGFAYGPYANTHCSIEDIAMMRVLPNMKVVCPANPLESASLTKQVLKIGGPAYLRIGRGKEPLPETEYSVKFGKGQVIKKGEDIVLISTGTILDEALKASNLLEKKGISAEVISMHTVKPIDKTMILERMSSRKAIFSLEEASIVGGLGGAIAEIISENMEKKAVFKRLGVKDKYLDEVGDQNYMRSRHEISAEFIVRSINDTLKKV